jgi:tripartite-type tricarboxylate transporter receptor subunit TctC
VLKKLGIDQQVAGALRPFPNGATAMLMKPQEFEHYMREDIAKWARVIKSADIKVD